MAAVSPAPVPERRKKRKSTRWGAEDDEQQANEDVQTSVQAAPATAEKHEVPPEAAEPSDPTLSLQPRKPKRSRWSTEEPEQGKTIPVPGLSAPVVLPASLAGLIDADAETLGLHRRLGEVSCAFVCNCEQDPRRLILHNFRYGTELTMYTDCPAHTAC